MSLVNGWLVLIALIIALAVVIHKYLDDQDTDRERSHIESMHRAGYQQEFIQGEYDYVDVNEITGGVVLPRTIHELVWRKRGEGQK